MAQGIECAVAEPLCADPNTNLIFENSNEGNSERDSAEQNIDYTCDSSTPQGDNDPEDWPYPAWYYIKIDQPGDLIFNIEQNSLPDQTGAELDIDFQAWGPFSTSSPNCQTDLTPSNRIDCSWSREAVEVLDIIDAQTGEFYILMLTNWSRQPGWITVEQTNFGEAGAGTTDCSIVTTSLGADRSVCEGVTVFLDAITPEVSSYEWFVDTTPDNGIDNFEQIAGESSATLVIDNNIGGIYRVVANRTDGTINSDDVLVEFSITERELDPIVACREEPYILPDGTEITENGIYRYRNTEECFIDIYDITFGICNVEEYCRPIIPTAFAPNNNGTNDFFTLFQKEECTLEIVSLSIYNRWGNKIYHDSSINWDGTANGKLEPTGLYFWTIEYFITADGIRNETKQTHSGTIQLLR